MVLHARLAEERGAFTFDDVARGLGAKMIRRNPHVFRPDGTLQDSFPAIVEEIVQKWDAVKRAEKPERTDPFEGIPQALPALARAQKSLDRAARAGVARGTSRKCPPAGARPSRRRRSSGTCCSPSSVPPHAGGLDAERALRGAIRRYQQQDAPEPRPAPHLP